MLRDAAIKEHNASGASWTMGHNHLSDMTEAEYKKLLGGRPSMPNSDVTEEIVGDSCVDNNASCSGWAAGGECTRNPGYMIPNCKKSCGTCGGPSPGPTPTNGIDWRTKGAVNAV